MHKSCWLIKTSIRLNKSLQWHVISSWVLTITVQSTTVITLYICLKPPPLPPLMYGLRLQTLKEDRTKLMRQTQSRFECGVWSAYIPVKSVLVFTTRETLQTMTLTAKVNLSLTKNHFVSCGSKHVVESSVLQRANCTTLPLSQCYSTK